MDVFAVVVLYNPDLDNVKRLVSDLSKNNVRSIVVDNSEQKINFSRDDFSEYIWMGGNKGIASAQNVGIEHAVSLRAEKIVFFDQDSQLTPDFIGSLLSTFNCSDVKIAAPVFYDIVKGFGYKLVDISPLGFRRKVSPEKLNDQLDISVTISSGTMVDASVFDKVGKMNDSLFIDYVDTEWCLRCLYHGYKVRINPAAVMYHSIGDKSLSFFGFNIPVHSPVRRYYRIRNSILLFGFPHVPKLLALREFVFAIIHQIIIITFSKNRLDQLKSMFSAVADGVLKRSGKK